MVMAKLDYFLNASLIKRTYIREDSHEGKTIRIVLGII